MKKKKICNKEKNLEQVIMEGKREKVSNMKLTNF